LCDEYGTKDVLDYGCGKRTLETALGFEIANYDPCIPGLDSPPKAHDIVVCTDVLEHIEPECLDAVLSDIRRCTKRVAFLLIATRPAKKFLADGRNAHLIQKDEKWWSERLAQAGFEITKMANGKGEFGVICRDALYVELG
jgi:2-polyprenyl-3-methyl-5-hydroxy-6-metoxy-1,4-benzoquinol methylase